MSAEPEPRVLCVGTWYTAKEAAALRAAAAKAGRTLSAHIHHLTTRRAHDDRV